jgi:type II secretory pathway component PulM
MMTDPPNSSSGMPSAPELREQSRKGLREFFQQKSIRNLVGVLVLSALAAILLPVFGPVVAGGAAAVAIQNGLKLLDISLSADTISKILKPLEGRQIDESDIQAVLQDLLPKDKQANDEAAKALVIVAPEVKEAAMTNPKIDGAWLGASLEDSLKDQGWVMARIAPQFRDFIQLDLAAVEAARNRLLADWQLISQEVTASEGSEVSRIEQNTEGKGGHINQRVAASEQSAIQDVRQNTKLT